MKPQNILHIEIQTNKEKTKNTEQNEIKHKLSDFFLDVAKYALAGIFFSTLLVLIESVFWSIFFSGISVVIFVILGIALTKIK